MDEKTIAALSADLIMRYYENDPMPFLEHMDDDALWYGPAITQFIKGREAMIRTWAKEENPLTFTMGNMKTQSISADASSCNVMLTYTVVTHYPGGQDISVDQRLLLCWGERKDPAHPYSKKKVPRILVCHISNPHGMHEDDVIYPKHFDQVYAGNSVMPQKGERIHLRGVDRSDYFFLSDTIYRIEATSGGKQSIIHSADGKVTVLATVSELEKLYGHLFLRCHVSHLVNPHYIRNIRRFNVTLTDSTVLPIPEKKYTAFRDKAVGR